MVNYYFLGGMFDRLKDKWGVSGVRLVLILCTFAIGGSLCGYGGRRVLEWVGLERKNVGWYVLYVVVVTVLWPFCVLGVSVFFGQFGFFRRYIGRMLGRMFGRRRG